MLYLIQGINYTNKQWQHWKDALFLESVSKVHILRGMRHFEYKGIFYHPNLENEKVVVGTMLDNNADESTLFDIRLSGDEFAFTKKYIKTAGEISYTFKKHSDGIWIGDYFDKLVGTGKSHCSLLSFPDDGSGLVS